MFNLRKNVFKDRRVREALGLAFDFEWSNKNLFFNQYSRTKSFFDNSEFASVGIPLGAELAILEPYRSKLPPEVFTQSFSLPKSKGDGNNRENLKKHKPYSKMRVLSSKMANFIHLQRNPIQKSSLLLLNYCLCLPQWNASQFLFRKIYKP